MLTLSFPVRVVGYLTLVILSALVLIPMLMVVLTAFKPENEIYSIIPWPQQPTLANFRRLFEASFGLYLWNSTATTILRVAGQLTIAVLAAYAFARFTFRGREALFALVLSALMVPHTLTMVPVYLLINRLGWFDTWAGLIVPNLAFPFGVFLLRQHIKAFPQELFDAAEMDGAGSLVTLRRIVLPNIGPALAALTIIASVETWNEYFWPLIVTESDSMRTLQLGLRRFLDADGAESYGPLMAGVTLVSLPALAVFFVLQRRVMETFVTSGLK